MAQYELTIAAATAVLGYDMARDEFWSVSGLPRVVRGFGVTGSAAAGDAGVDLMIGGIRVSRKYNTTTGFPTMDHVQPLDAYVPPGEKISLPVFDAPATNPLNVIIIVEDI